MKKLCFILRTNFATRRTLVRLRANKIKSEALILPSLSVLHLISLSPKKELQKNLRFFCSSFSINIYLLMFSHLNMHYSFSQYRLLFCKNTACLFQQFYHNKINYLFLSLFSIFCNYLSHIYDK